MILVEISCKVSAVSEACATKSYPYGLQGFTNIYGFVSIAISLKVGKPQICIKDYFERF